MGKIIPGGENHNEGDIVNGRRVNGSCGVSSCSLVAEGDHYLNVPSAIADQVAASLATNTSLKPNELALTTADAVSLAGNTTGTLSWMARFIPYYGLPISTAFGWISSGFTAWGVSLDISNPNNQARGVIEGLTYAIAKENAKVGAAYGAMINIMDWGMYLEPNMTYTESEHNGKK